MRPTMKERRVLTKAVCERYRKSGAKRVVVPNMTDDWIVRPLELRGDLKLVPEEGVVVTAKHGQYRGKARR